MANRFLTASWLNLLMANYEIDPAILKKYIPSKTELDDYNGSHYVSLVGFLFKDTKVSGISFPFHRTFEEVNLRFYVRYKEKNEWKRGVVFIKEVVPRRLISFIANTIYRENYICRPMKHKWKSIDDDLIAVEYYWKNRSEWNHIKAIASRQSHELIEDSEEMFITEHYWGYTQISTLLMGEYQVTHPKWRIHTVHSYDIHCNTELLYGKDFVSALQQEPRSVFLAEGSDICVLKGKKIIC